MAFCFLGISGHLDAAFSPHFSLLERTSNNLTIEDCEVKMSGSSKIQIIMILIESRAQFPCSQVRGDKLYDLFWEAICQLENCGLKVCTLIHNSAPKVFYICIPYARY